MRPPHVSSSLFPQNPRFAFVRHLGTGGMGVVYEALDRERNARVALKTLHSLSAEGILLFKNEFRSLQDLHHPNLVTLGELFEAQGRWFFTMGLVSGQDFLSHVAVGGGAAGASAAAASSGKDTLRILVEESTLAPPLVPSELPPACDEQRLRACLCQLASGLVALHAAGKVHRDIKPSNVLVDERGHLTLLDFGIVTDLWRRAAPGEPRIFGTAAYMAPEQAEARAVGPAADWYSVGVMMFQALTGRLPFAVARDGAATLSRALDPVPPSALVRGVPRDLDELCHDLLRPEPALRPSGRQVLHRLDAPAPAELPLELELEPRALAGLPETFVGRQSELDALRRALGEVQDGPSLIVLVHGESGVGKSALVRRFVEEVQATAPQMLVLCGRCYERESVPYKGFDEIMDALSLHLRQLPPQALAPLVDPGMAVLAQAFPVLRPIEALAEAPSSPAPAASAASVDPKELRTQVFARIRELLRRLASRSPVILVIDDFQWTDADSRALLEEVLRPPDAPRVLLLATVRTGAEDPDTLADLEAHLRGGVRALALGNLAPDDARSLAALLLDRAGRWSAERARAETIAGEAGGHPLFIDELVRHEVASGQPAAPPDLEEVLWSRVRRLPDRARSLLDLIALSGVPISQELAARAAGMDFGELAQHATALRAARLVRTGGADRRDPIEPYHDRVRQAVLSHLEASARAGRHRRLALAFESARESDPEILAFHYRQAGESDIAGKYMLRAAEQADEALAFDRAARLYRLALDPLAGAAERAVRVKLAAALANAGRGAQAAAEYLAAAGHGSDVESLELEQRAAEQLLISGHIDAGLAASRNVLAKLGMRLPGQSRRALLPLLWHRARVRLRGRRFRPDTAARPEAWRERLRKIDICWTIARGFGIVDPARGAYFQTRQLLHALQAGEPKRIARALAMEAAYAAASGGPTRRRTLRLLDETRSLAERTGDPLAQAMAIGVTGIAEFLVGNFGAARRHCERAEAELRSRCSGVAWEVDSMFVFTLWSLYQTGELAELARRIRRGLGEAERRGDRYVTTLLRTGALNFVWLAEDDPQGARAQAEEAMQKWSHQGFLMQHEDALVAHANIDLYLGDAPSAHRRVTELWPALRRSLLLTVQFTRVEALELRGRAALAAACSGRSAPSAARRLLRAAERDARRIGGERMVWSAPLASLLLSGVAGARGEREAAVLHLRRAVSEFEQSEMKLGAAVARRRLGELVGGSEGAALRETAEDWMKRQGVTSPARVTALFAPGARD